MAVEEIVAAVAGKGRAQPAEVALVARSRIALVAEDAAEGDARPKKSGTGGRLIFLVLPFLRVRVLDRVPAGGAPEVAEVALLPSVAVEDVVIRDR